MQLIKIHVCTRIAPSFLLQNAEGSYFVFITHFIIRIKYSCIFHMRLCVFSTGGNVIKTSGFFGFISTTKTLFPFILNPLLVGSRVGAWMNQRSCRFKK